MYNMMVQALLYRWENLTLINLHERRLETEMKSMRSFAGYRLYQKSVPLRACSGPVGSTKLRLPDFMTTAQDGSKVVSVTHQPPLPPGNTPGTHFC